MSLQQALVLRTAGINCDGETVRALEQAGAKVDLVHLQRVLAEPARLDDYGLLVIPGGFSYGDDVAAGRVFGLELRHGLARELAAFVARGGYVLGVCNGFQVLVESGLFEPGFAGAPAAALPDPGRAPRPPESAARALPPGRDIALTNNLSNRFECRWVEVRAEDCAASWLTAGETMPMPVAHGEGRFVVRDEATLQRLVARRQIALTYVGADGRPTSSHPANPNGSVAAIAGICDPSGRVLGLMPHPERNLSPWNHPHWTRLARGSDRGRRTAGEGLGFYRRLVEAASGAPV
jgi:phosphoribosylformylglycinamidine synthase subunit PurQ / glutaminase